MSYMASQVLNNEIHRISTTFSVKFKQFHGPWKMRSKDFRGQVATLCLEPIILRMAVEEWLAMGRLVVLPEWSAGRLRSKCRWVPGELPCALSDWRWFSSRCGSGTRSSMNWEASDMATWGRSMTPARNSHCSSTACSHHVWPAASRSSEDRTPRKSRRPGRGQRWHPWTVRTPRRKYALKRRLQTRYPVKKWNTQTLTVGFHYFTVLSIDLYDAWYSLCDAVCYLRTWG